MKQPCLIWFYSDLRLQDNPALHQAALAGPVITVFNPCFTQWPKPDWGANKINCVLRQVQMLAANFASRNIPLLCLEANTFEQVPDAMLELYPSSL